MPRTDDKNFINRINARVWEDNILEKLRVSYTAEKSEDKSGDTGDRSGYKSEDKSGDTGDRSGYKSEDKQEVKSINKHRDLKFLLLNLKGLQSKLFNHISGICLVNEYLSTGPQKTTKIALEIGCSYDSTKKTIARLIQKGLLKRLKGKSSCGGFINLYITQETKYAILEDRSGDRSEDKSNSSSSYIYNNTTTTERPDPNQTQSRFSTEWEQMDIEPLKKIGFTAIHVSQIAAQNKLLPQIVQDSIYAFAFDLQENNKAKSIKGDPVNFFMGILRKGQPYATPSNYESPQDKAMRFYRENMRALEHRRIEVEKEAITLAFNDWFAKLTDDQKIGLLPELLRRGTNSEKLRKSKVLESSAKNHFEKEVWPVEKAKIVANKEQGGLY